MDFNQLSARNAALILAYIFSVFSGADRGGNPDLNVSNYFGI
jgi:hypothetical protein